LHNKKLRIREKIRKAMKLGFLKESSRGLTRGFNEEIVKEN